MGKRKSSSQIALFASRMLYLIDKDLHEDIEEIISNNDKSSLASYLINKYDKDANFAHFMEEDDISNFDRTFSEIYLNLDDYGLQYDSNGLILVANACIKLISDRLFDYEMND